MWATKLDHTDSSLHPVQKASRKQTGLEACLDGRGQPPVPSSPKGGPGLVQIRFTGKKERRKKLETLCYHLVKWWDVQT